MTREEATTKLKWFLESNLIEDISGCEGLEEAIDMAIEALSNTPNALNALDCISRQAAIDLCDWYDNPSMHDDLEKLPSAQPEQKKGKWIIRDNPGTGWYRVTCSECGEDVTSTIPMIGFFPNAKPLWDYCPYCGAKMEE